jgi:hypothetical protein
MNFRGRIGVGFMPPAVPPTAPGPREPAAPQRVADARYSPAVRPCRSSCSGRCGPSESRNAGPRGVLPFLRQRYGTRFRNAMIAVPGAWHAVARGRSPHTLRGCTLHGGRVAARRSAGSIIPRLHAAAAWWRRGRMVMAGRRIASLAALTCERSRPFHPVVGPAPLLFRFGRSRRATASSTGGISPCACAP